MPEPTAQRRVTAFLDAYEAEGVGDDIARADAASERPHDLTATDLRALLALASLGRQVLDHLHTNLDDDGVLAPTTARCLAEDVDEWRLSERRWTWHAAETLAESRRAAAYAAERAAARAAAEKG